MSPIIVAIVLILAGLLMCRFCGSVKGVLGTVVYWAGVLLLVVGLLLLLFPVMAWIYKQLTDALGMRGWNL